MIKQTIVIAGTMLATASQAIVLFSGSPYSENFDTLPAAGSNTWTNDSTVNGWFGMKSNLGSATDGVRDTGAGWGAQSTIVADAGTTNGGYFSYGTGSASERALGGINTNANGDNVYAVVLQNTSGFDMTSFSLSYVGEQWRNNGNATPQKLVFDYGVVSTFTGGGAVAQLRADNTAGYTALTSLNFTGPIATATAAALDGNASANRVSLSASAVPVTWTNSSFLILRWWDDNATGNDHGLAIDNVSFSAVPEPATCAIVGVGVVAMLRRRRKN